MANISDRIKSLRLSADMTQKEFGDIFGIVKSTVSLYESGKSTPNDELKMQICSYFGISTDYLLGLTDERCPVPKKEDHPISIQSDNNSRFFFFFFDELLKDVFVSRLKKSLDEKGLSLDEFSKTVSFDTEKCVAYLSGKCEPSLEDLIEISHTLGVSIDYLLGQIPTITSLEKKLLNTFVKLDEDNQDIIIGKAKELLKEQRCESSVAADEKYADSQGKSQPSSGTGGGTIAV